MKERENCRFAVGAAALGSPRAAEGSRPYAAAGGLSFIVVASVFYEKKRIAKARWVLQ